ncbi:hypothetical protein OHB41_26050 [Streptomyces sp. NBC_01571]|uniref:hypothetical protein n=1 Tax=Streptomyces sp. NBC_01571 TaxID=2975883 RepID=UPI002253A6D5|nr:hypothetical protein [Streptomyces sp. NBC_01571]MCX4576574.1 hypothetical protein [Streptomyces sp. NBC_01571]
MTTPTPADIAPKYARPNSPSTAARFAVEQVAASLAESIEQDDSLDLDAVAALAELTRHLAALTQSQAAMMNAIRAKHQTASAFMAR